MLRYLSPPWKALILSLFFILISLLVQQKYEHFQEVLIEFLLQTDFGLDLYASWDIVQIITIFCGQEKESPVGG